MALTDFLYIITNRFSKHNKWDEIVYEWEDVFIELGNLSLWNEPSIIKKRIFKKIPLIRRFILPPKLAFVYEMRPTLWNKLYNNKKIISCIIDYYLDEEDTERFILNYNKIGLLCVSSREVYDYLAPKWRGKGRLCHLALSISDIYKITPDTKYKKEYDVVCLGRINSVLKKFLFLYKQSHPDLSFVYCEGAMCDFHYFTSSGDDLGNMNSREEYLELMKKGKCGLYSTPGVDGENYTNGFSQVTPRFLEYLVCGCHVIARFKKNSDTDYYRLNEMALPATSYEEFEKSLDYALNNEVDMTRYSIYLEKHYTSKRVKELINVLKG
jgi:hypothetical protein